MDCIYLVLYLVTLIAFYSFASPSPPPHGGRAAIRALACSSGAGFSGMLSSSGAGFSSMLKDTPSHDHGGVGDQTTNLKITERPSLSPEPEPPTQDNIFVIILK